MCTKIGIFGMPSYHLVASYHSPSEVMFNALVMYYECRTSFTAHNKTVKIVFSGGRSVCVIIVSLSLTPPVQPWFASISFFCTIGSAGQQDV
jgi:hypothetical protein